MVSFHLSFVFKVKPRRSIDQMSNDDQPQIIQTISNAASIGPNGRRLSKNGERTSTPPRKILPKTSENLDRAATTGSPHLPVGVVGAALSSTRLTNSPLGSAVALKAAALGEAHTRSFFNVAFRVKFAVPIGRLII